MQSVCFQIWRILGLQFSRNESFSEAFSYVTFLGPMYRCWGEERKGSSLMKLWLLACPGGGHKNKFSWLNPIFIFFYLFWLASRKHPGKGKYIATRRIGQHLWMWEKETWALMIWMQNHLQFPCLSSLFSLCRLGSSPQNGVLICQADQVSWA